MGKFDCVYRHRRILPSTPIEGLKVSETEDECTPKGEFIPCGVPCRTTCPLYVSRYGKTLHDEVEDEQD